MLYNEFFFEYTEAMQSCFRGLHEIGYHLDLLTL